MADNNSREFKIIISSDASALVACGAQSSAALKGVTEEAKNSAKAQKEADKEAAEAAKEAREQKHSLKSAVKGLKEEFPELAHLAKLALNPIAFVVAGIGGAWALWNKKIEETTRLFANVELPNNKAMEPGHINAMAEAWAKYAETVEKTVRSLDSVDAVYKHVLDTIDQALARQKALIAAQKAFNDAATSADTPAGQRAKLSADAQAEVATTGAELAARQKKIDAEQNQAADLDKDAAKKREEASHIRVASQKDDTETLASYKANAEVAEKEMKEREERRTKLIDYKGGTGTWVDSMWVKAQQFYTGLTVDEMIGQEDQGIASNKRTIDAYSGRLKRQPGRDKSRAERERLLGEAADEEGRGLNLFYGQSADEQSALDLDRRSAGQVGGLNQMTRLRVAQSHAEQQALGLQKEIEQSFKTGAGVSMATLQLLREWRALMTDLQAQIAELRKNQPRTAL